MSRYATGGMSAADFMATLGTTPSAGARDRLAQYDAMLARLDAEIAIANQAPSLEALLAARGDEKEQS